MIGASKKEAAMGRRARVDRTPEQKLEIVLKGLKSGNIAETCRRYEIAANLYYGWKDEALRGATAALGVRSAAAAESEEDQRIMQLERSLGRKALEFEILKKSWGSGLRRGLLPGAGVSGVRLRAEAGGGCSRDESIELVLPQATPWEPSGSTLG